MSKHFSPVIHIDVFSPQDPKDITDEAKDELIRLCLKTGLNIEISNPIDKWSGFLSPHTLRDGISLGRDRRPIDLMLEQNELVCNKELMQSFRGMPDIPERIKNLPIECIWPLKKYQ